MNAQELRIGNYVSVPNKKQTPFKVDYFDDAKVYKENGTYTCEPFGEIPMHPLTWDLEQCSGIPLTPEILEKAGFEKGDNKFVSDSFYCIRVGGSTFTINPLNGVVWIKRNDNVFNNPQLIKYLHQLQNLYFALTGEELNIEL